MLDRALLSPEAIAYFNALPLDAQIALEKSNTSFRSLDDIQDYQQRMFSHVNDVLYKQLPEPAIPSNAALDPLDADLNAEGAADRPRLLHSFRDLVMGPITARHTQRLTFHVFSHIMERNLFALHYIPVLPGCEITSTN